MPWALPLDGRVTVATVSPWGLLTESLTVPFSMTIPRSPPMTSSNRVTVVVWLT